MGNIGVLLSKDKKRINKIMHKVTKQEILRAIQQDTEVLYFLEEQKKEYCEEAIKKNPNAIHWVREQTDELCELAFSYREGSLEYIRNEEFIKKKISEKKGVIRGLKNDLKEKYSKFALETDPFAIIYIENPTAEEKEYALSEDPKMLKWIKEPSEKEILIALSKDGEQIKNVENPSIQAILTAVKQTESAMYYIKDDIIEENYKKMLEANYKTFDYMEKNEEKIEYALSITGQAFQYLSGDDREKFKKKALKNEITNEEYEKMTREERKDFFFILEEIDEQTEEDCIISVRRNQYSYIAVENKTKKVKEVLIQELTKEKKKKKNHKL